MLLQLGARRAAPRSRGAQLAALAVLGPASHILLDSLARLTYHPPDARPADPFWLGYHVAALALTLALAWKLRALWLGMAAALLPDVDWVLRALPWTPPHWHGRVHETLRSLPGLSHAHAWTQTLPSLTNVPWAALPELAVGVAALIVVMRAPPPPQAL